MAAGKGYQRPGKIKSTPPNRRARAADGRVGGIRLASPLSRATWGPTINRSGLSGKTPEIGRPPSRPGLIKCL